MTKRVYILAHQTARDRAANDCLTAPEGWVVRISEPTRSLEQNAAQWPILDAFSKQLKWPVNGKLESITPEEFKDILTAAFRQEKVRLAQALDGGVVMLGVRTSHMFKHEFSEWLDFLHAVAADRGVDLTKGKE